MIVPVNWDLLLSAKFACAVVARERDAPVIMREREAIPMSATKGRCRHCGWTEGIAVQRDVVQNPAGVKRNEQMPVPVAASGFLTGEVFSPAGRSGAVPRSSGRRIP